jgi:hypothetical protein
MINVTKIFLDSAPSRYRLGFGVSENSVLKSVSNEIRRNKDGVKIDKCCYMTFAKLAKEDEKVLAESTFSFFIIDKPDYAKLNFMHQILQMLEILSAVVPADKSGAVLKGFNKSIQKHGKIMMMVKNQQKFTKAETKSISSAQMGIVDSFKEFIDPFTNTAGDKVDLLIVSNRTGKFLDLPREDKGFIAKTGGKNPLSVSVKYKTWYANRNIVETDEADDMGSDEVMKDEEILVADDQMLDDI